MKSIPIRWGLYLSLLLVCFVAYAQLPAAFPRADECYRTGTLSGSSVLGRVKAEYFEWTGRWSGILPVYWVGQNLSLEGSYAWCLLLLSLGLPLSIYFLLYAAFGDRLGRGDRATATLAFFCFNWTRMPSTGEAFYWMTGAIENQLPIAMDIFVLALLVLQARHPEQKSGWTAALAGLAGLAGLVAFVATCMHELYAAMFCAVLVAGTLIAFERRYSTRWLWMATAAMAILGTFIVIAAPGQWRRLDLNGARHDFATLSQAVRLFHSRVNGWPVDPALWLATALALRSYGSMAGRLPVEGRWSLRSKMILGAGVLSLPAIFLGFGWWVQQGHLPGRTWSALYTVFLVLWFALLIPFLHSKVQWRGAPVNRAGMVLGFALALLLSGNFISAANDLRGPLWTYRTAMKERYQLMRTQASQGIKHLRITPLPVVPTQMPFSEIGGNPTDMLNHHLAKYFRVRSVALVPKKAAVSTPAIP